MPYEPPPPEYHGLIVEKSMAIPAVHKPVGSKKFTGSFPTYWYRFACPPANRIGSFAVRPSGDEVLREQGFVVLEQVREAFCGEATELCSQDELDFEHGGTATTDERDGAQSDRADRGDGPVVTRHRLSPATVEAGAGRARRVIVHRDHRRGRPPGTPSAKGRRATDPPD